MRTKLIFLNFIVSVIAVHAQVQTQAEIPVWDSFMIELNKGIKIEEEHAYMSKPRNYNLSSRKKIVSVIMNSSIEEKAIEYMYENFRRSPLVNLRLYIREILYKIAANSTNSSSRQKALSYIFDIYDELIIPKLDGLWLKDFNDEIKQKLLRLISHQYTQEELLFYAESIVTQDMTTYKDRYDSRIADSLRKNKSTFEEVWQRIYQAEVKEQIEIFYNNKPEHRFYSAMMIAGQLNLVEAVPFLKEYADNEKYENTFQTHAIFSLACMRIEDYEQKAVEYFRTDGFVPIRLIQEVINSQDLWYTYIERLKSKKYLGKCPVAYETVRDLQFTLIGFPYRYPPKEEITTLYHEPEPKLIPDDCGFTDEPMPIDDAVIKIVVDWMEENKGNYKLLRPFEKTY
jgi:hypothetical protein